MPRTDGVFLTDYSQQLVLKGEVANVPFVTGMSQFRSIPHITVGLIAWEGDCDDEGISSLPGLEHLTYYLNPRHIILSR